MKHILSNLKTKSKTLFVGCCLLLGVTGSVQAADSFTLSTNQLTSLQTVGNGDNKTTVSVLLPFNTYQGTNALVFVSTNIPNINQYVGYPALFLVANTNNTQGAYSVQIISSNVVTAALTTNAFLPVNGWTNACQVLLFDTTANGTLVQIQYLMPTAVTNQFGVLLQGKLKNQ